MFSTRKALIPLLLLILVTLSSSHLQGQSKKSVQDSIGVLQNLLSELPLTKFKSRGSSAAKSQYKLAVDFETASWTLTDNRTRNGKVNPNDGYVILIPLADLHRDGILLINDETKKTVSLSILAVENKKAFQVTPLLAKNDALGFPQDRVLLGPWTNSDPNILPALNRIKNLLSWIAKKEGSKRKKLTPTFERANTQAFSATSVKPKALPPGSKATSKTALAAAEMDRPPLFQNSTDLSSTKKAVKAYILSQLKAKDIALKFSVHGKFIVNEQGKVNFVRIDFAMDKGAKKLVEDILKNMPIWKPGSKDSQVRSGLISFALEAKK